MIKRFIFNTGIILLLFCSNLVLGQQTDELSKLKDIVSKFDLGKSAPGGVITVSRNGQIIFNQAVGSADLTHDIANTNQTIFEAGSVSKQFTATAVLLLIREKKLNLNDDIRQFIPELPNYGKPILVKHLLTHTSGVKDWGSLFRIAGWSRGTKAYEQVDALNMICQQKSLNFLPGEQYSYSNSNSTLLAVMVGRLTKMPFAKFCEINIFKPIGMSNTRWRDNFRAIVPGRAIGYMKVKNNYYQDMPFENTHGHGGLLTTTTDLLKWLNYWQKDGFGKELSIMRTTAGTLTNGQRILYTLGAVRLNKLDSPTEIYHSGLTAGYRGWLAYYPKKNIALACLGNGLTLPSKKLTELFDGKYPALINRGSIALPADMATKLKGVYKAVGGSDLLEIIEKNGKPYMSAGAEILGYRQDTLSTGSRYIVPLDNFNRFISIGNDGITTYEKMKNTPLNTADYLKKFVGYYSSVECDADFSFKLEGNKLVLNRNNREQIALQAIYQNAFIAKGVLLVFDDNGNLTANVDRANNVVFEKQVKR